MSALRWVLVTEDLHEYALAAAAHRRIAARLQLATCYPVLLPQNRIEDLKSLLVVYGIRPKSFVSISGKGDLESRSERIRQLFFAETSTPVVVSPDAAADALAHAVFLSATADRPLVYSRTGNGSVSLADTAAETGRAGHWILARAGSSLSVSAALYAAATGKRLRLVGGGRSLAEELEAHMYSTAILVDDYQAFEKGMLAKVARMAGGGPQMPLQPGIMTGSSVSQFSGLVWRRLVQRDFRESGRCLDEPTSTDLLPLRGLPPLEYYVLAGHGNELHIHQGEHEVLCGAYPPTLREERNGFNCEPGCPYAGRVRASDLPVQSLVLLSCDSFTLGDGFVPPQYSVLLNLLNGWCTSVIASFQHAMVNPNLPQLADALIRTGYNLGQITERLNTLARFNGEPDASYLLLGDPEVVPAPGRRWVPPDIRLTEHKDSLEVECSSTGGRTLDCLIPAERVAHLSDDRRPLTVDPVSARLADTEMRFGFRPNKGSGDLGVLVFSPRELPTDQLRFKLVLAHQLSDTELMGAQASAQRILELAVHGLDPSLLRVIADQALSLPNALAAHPRLLESILAHRALSRYRELQCDVLDEVRRAVLTQVLQLMGEDGLWISHKYARAYAKVGKVADGSPDCAFCGNETAVWRYEGGAMNLPPRGPQICVRCGILTDTPHPAELSLLFEPVRVISGTDLHQRMKLRNRSSRRLDIAVAVQFNEWMKQRIYTEPNVQSLALEPGESRVLGTQFMFEKPLTDDIASMHAFVLTTDFGLHCFTQRLLIAQRGLSARVATSPLRPQ